MSIEGLLKLLSSSDLIRLSQAYGLHDFLSKSDPNKPKVFIARDQTEKEQLLAGNKDLTIFTLGECHMLHGYRGVEVHVSRSAIGFVLYQALSCFTSFSDLVSEMQLGFGRQIQAWQQAVQQEKQLHKNTTQSFNEEFGKIQREFQSAKDAIQDSIEKNKWLDKKPKKKLEFERLYAENKRLKRQLATVQSERDIYERKANK